MNRKEILAFFRDLPESSPSVECSGAFPSLLNLPSSEPLDNVGDSPIYNGMSLDDLDSSSDMLKARKNERADLTGAAIAAGVDAVEDSKKLKL